MISSVWIGYDPREAGAFVVARQSARRRTIMPLPIRGIILEDVIQMGLYNRETIKENGRLFDTISEHPMSTEFAISRFLTPRLSASLHPGHRDRWALFMDCDVLVRHDLKGLLAQANKDYAVMVVKHDFQPQGSTKMDGQVQSRYHRKNWSSVMLWNVDHPANKRLTLGMINELPGRDLHRFCWLEDHEIGELDASWNYLVGHHTKDDCADPSIVHFTDGIPTMPGYENSEYADEWTHELARWAA